MSFEFPKFHINKYMLSASVIAIIFIAAMLYYHYKTEKPIPECICVFDLDDTITCGFDNAKSAIEECKNRSCVFAVNTARTSPYYADIKFGALGIHPEIFKDNFYHGTWNNKMSYTDRDSLINEIAKTKVKHLDTLHKKYGTAKDKIILFDDNDTNINLAKYHGYSTVHANHENCGLNNNVVKEISDILDP